MNIIYEDGLDKGHPCWRASLSYNKVSIKIKTENFKYGFRDGESYNKISVFRTYSGTGKYELYVSVITKNPSKLEQYKIDVVEKFNWVLEHNLKVQKKIITDDNKLLKTYEDLLSSDIFKDTIRDRKLQNILEDEL